MADDLRDAARQRISERLGNTESGRDPKLDAPGDVEAAPEPSEQPSDPHAAPLDDVQDAKYLAEDDPRRQEIEKWSQQPSEKGEES